MSNEPTLMSAEFAIVNQYFFLPKEAILAEVERALQEATIQWKGYVDRNSRERKFHSGKPEADDAKVAEEKSKTHKISATPETDLSKREKNGVEKIDKRLKLLKSLKATFF